MESSKCTMKGVLDDAETLMSPFLVIIKSEPDFEGTSEDYVIEENREETENTEARNTENIECEMKSELDDAESLMSPLVVPIESEPAFEVTSENTIMEETLETTDNTEDIFVGEYAMKKDLNTTEASIAKAESDFEKTSGEKGVQDSQARKIAEVCINEAIFWVKEEPIDAKETWQDTMKLEATCPLSVNTLGDGSDESSEDGVNVKIEDIVTEEELLDELTSPCFIKGERHDISKVNNRQPHLDCSPLPCSSTQFLSEMEGTVTQKQFGCCSFSSSRETDLLPIFGCQNVLAAASCSPAADVYLSRRCAEQQVAGEIQQQHSDQTDAKLSASHQETDFQGEILQSDSLRSRTGERRFKCSFCKNDFKRKSHLIEHMRIHSGDQPYKCSLCGESFKTSSTLTKHMRKHTGDRPYKCCQCGKSFTLSGALRNHMRTHTGYRPFICSQCGQSFSRRDHLTVHMRKHTGDRPYKCSQCGKSFKENGTLNIHIRNHTGDRPYKCSQCGKSFKLSGALTNHMRTHTGYRPFICSQCGQSFSRSDYLTVHMRKHTGDRPYKCSQCGKSFKENGALTNHMRTHTGDRPFGCSQCGQSFSRRSILTVHMRTHTGDRPYKCSECGKSFTDSGHLTVHMRKHTGERPYKCSQCGKSFKQTCALTNHMLTHTGVRRYKCSQCEECFILKGHLTRHMRKHTTDLS